MWPNTLWPLQIWGLYNNNDAAAMRPLTVYISNSPWWWYGAVCVFNVTVTETRRPYIAMCSATVTDAQVSWCPHIIMCRCGHTAATDGVRPLSCAVVWHGAGAGSLHMGTVMCTKPRARMPTPGHISIYSPIGHALLPLQFITITKPISSLGSTSPHLTLAEVAPLRAGELTSLHGCPYRHICFEPDRAHLPLPEVGHVPSGHTAPICPLPVGRCWLQSKELGVWLVRVHRQCECAPPLCPRS